MLLTPAPDPAPHSGNAPIVYVAYDYTVAARFKKTGRIIPGYYFLCHVSAAGKRHCVFLKGNLPAR